MVRKKASLLSSHLVSLSWKLDMYTLGLPPNLIALFPGLPCFCSYTCVQCNTRKQQQRQGRPGNTYHVNDMRWTQGGRMWGGRGLHSNTWNNY